MKVHPASIHTCECGHCLWCAAIAAGLSSLLADQGLRADLEQTERSTPDEELQSKRSIAACERRRKQADHCICKGQKTCAFCWDQIFERNHGAEAKEYYAPRPPKLCQSSLAYVTGLDMDGCGRELGLSQPDAFRSIMHDQTVAAMAERDGNASSLDGDFTAMKSDRPRWSGRRRAA